MDFYNCQIILHERASSIRFTRAPTALDVDKQEVQHYLSILLAQDKEIDIICLQ